jgi:hypothetical protein
MKRTDLSVGQDVIIRRASDKHRPVRPGRITRVGRTLVTILQSPDEKYPQSVEFYIDSQRERSDYSPARFLTLDQQAMEEQLGEDLPRLRGYGFIPADHSRPDPGVVRALVEFLDQRAAMEAGQ